MITSSSNTKVKYVGRLQTDRRFRWRERMFVVEGERAVRDAVKSHRPSLILHSSAVTPPPTTVEMVAVSDELMRQMSDVETPPGILAVTPFPTLELAAEPSLLLILDGVQTPGNMGTMLRTAAAAGVDGVLLAPGCVDPFNPKVVRGGMGAQWRIPLVKASWAEIERQTAGMNVWIASAESATPYTQVNWIERSALVIGNEANGPSAAAQRLGRGVMIPMAADVESLNAAMASGIILFEVARQRGELS